VGANVKLGATVTVRAIVVDAVRLPEVPVMVTIATPVVAVLPAVSVTPLVPVVGLVPKLAVTPLGKPLTVKVTLPVNPFAPVRVIESLALLPCVTDNVDAVGASVKLGATLTVKLCCTCGAAAKEVLPAWFALIVQVPAIRNVAVVFETVQTLVVADVNATAKPEVAVAVSVSGVPTICVPGLLKLMVCPFKAAAVPLSVTLADGALDETVAAPLWLPDSVPVGANTKESSQTLPVASVAVHGGVPVANVNGPVGVDVAKALSATLPAFST
jgi:hypothetical protein